MNEEQSQHSCGCRGPSGRARSQPPEPNPAFAAPLPQEVTLHREGAAPLNVLLDSEEANPQTIRRLAEGLPDLPRLEVGRDTGAIDLRLEDSRGTHVKEGSLLLQGPSGTVALKPDPATRRFRQGNLRAGRYTVRAASAQHGRGDSVIEVRAGDVVRRSLALDGRPVQGTADIDLEVRGAASDRVEVRVTDRRTGHEIFSKRARVTNGKVHVDDLKLGAWHIDIRDDAGARSCYDLDGGDSAILQHFKPVAVVLEPRPIDPNPPDPLHSPFFGLADRYTTLMSVLPDIGVQSIEALASAEGEDLMHRLRVSERHQHVDIPNPVIGGAILEARALLGHARVGGTHEARFTLGDESSYRRSFLPAAPGKAKLVFELPRDATAEVTVTRGSATEHRTVRGKRSITIDVTAEDVAAANAVDVRVRNVSGRSVPIRWASTFPAGAVRPNLVATAIPTTRANIEAIYGAWAAQNPGVSPNVVDTSLDPENIRGWLDRARSLLTLAGVCSLNDLGTFRMQPNRVIRPGAYVAPARRPLSVTDVVALTHYAFSDIINNSVVHYVPNDTLHETAVVIGGAWDIRGQVVVIGAEVRELTVIVQSIQFDAATRITWEKPALPGPRTYFPDKAPRGADGTVRGERGHDGAPGDQDPHPARNGGANADQAGPIVTMYVLNATSNLPPIDLRGQKGGVGGRGQDGGDGGNGAKGPDAESHFLSGCCRAVGWGGNGGTAGAAGRGGQGGRGGPGGRITVLTSEASIAVMAGAAPKVDLNGGEGGDGGVAGSPGVGGKGGEAGSADCELWCPSHPERHGSDGGVAPGGGPGRQGDPGPLPLPDAPQIYPVTEEQWTTAFNQPHILQVSPTDAEPGETVTLLGQNFQPATDRVYFDGVLQASGVISSSTTATFTVPLTSEGGPHPIVIRPAGVTSRISNRVWLRVIPKLDPIPAGTRWSAGQIVQLTGLAFSPGCSVFVEDWSVNPHLAFTMPVTSNTRTAINVTMPAALTGNIRGVRRVIVQNPDGGRNRGETIVRIGDTIVVNVAAFKVAGSTPGTGSTRSDADIASLFVEGGANAASIPWAQARIVFRLVQPVQTVTTDDLRANTWPKDQAKADEVQFAIDHGAVRGAINVFFFRDIEDATAHAWFGGGPVFYGEEPGSTITATDFYQIIAHEIGHAFCLDHVCPNSDETPADTFFNRACQGGDDAFLMYPYWDASDSMTIPQGQIDQARTGATHVEQGRIHLAANLAFACGVVDSQG